MGQHGAISSCYLDGIHLSFAFLQIDDVKCDERIRYNGSVDGAGGRGWCREHTKFGMGVTSYDDVLMWKECLDKGEAHLAKEITCVALGPLREADHSAKVIFASGTCKKDESGVSQCFIADIALSRVVLSLC